MMFLGFTSRCTGAATVIARTAAEGIDARLGDADTFAALARANFGGFGCLTGQHLTAALIAAADGASPAQVGSAEQRDQ